MFCVIVGVCVCVVCVFCARAVVFPIALLAIFNWPLDCSVKRGEPPARFASNFQLPGVRGTHTHIYVFVWRVCAISVQSASVEFENPFVAFDIMGEVYFHQTDWTELLRK